ncbi:MAG: protein translocase subunit SecD [Clostridia bacterium]|nr:protein translocase subunit SecD [Clostridia bacterium]
MGKSIVTFVASLIVIAILVTVTLTGFNLGVVSIPKVQDGIRLGLDLKGGSVITFEAQIEEGMDTSNLKADMETAQTVLRKRLDDQMYNEATVQLVGDTRIRVEIPEITNPEEAVELLGKTAVLEFRDADGNVGLTGNDIKEAKSEYGQIDQNGPMQYFISLKLKPEAVAKFTEITKAAANRSAEGKNFVAIYMDNVVQSSPLVDAEYAATGINTEDVTITVGAGEGALGATPAEYSKNLASIINSGRLPFALKEIELRSVGPTLGEKALESSLFAALIGLILVMIFMIVIYRLPGVVASISLIFYTAIVAIILAVLKINLSLPGIAGIILSIGMAVDANVIIFERIKDELRAGKTIKASIDAGFKRAVTAVIDSNVTTIIAALVLGYFGTGSIQGFAWTLGIGVAVSLFTAVFVTRFLLNRLVGMNIKSLKAYGA